VYFTEGGCLLYEVLTECGQRSVLINAVPAVKPSMVLLNLFRRSRAMRGMVWGTLYTLAESS